MNKYISLTKVLLKSGNSSLKTYKTKKYKGYLLTLLIVIAFLPLAGGLGTLTARIFDILLKIHQEGIVLGISLPIVSSVIFFLGLFYVISVFYFTKDIETLLPLPLSPSTIVGAKFTLTMIYEYITGLILLLPVLLVFGFKNNESILYYIFAAVIFLMIPVAPLVLASIINMIIMRFTNIAKNKDRFRVLSGIIAIFMGLSLNYFMQNIEQSFKNESQLQQLLIQGNNSLLNLTSSLFPSTKFAALALINSTSINGLLNLIIFIAINVALVSIFVILGNTLYFKGVIGASESASARKSLSEEEFDKSISHNSTIKALWLTELRLLFRTPIYFMNCVLMNFLWPLFLLLPLIFQPDFIKKLHALGNMANNSMFAGVIFSIVFAVSMFFTSINSITATAISREGQNIFVKKYLPISYKVQIMAKVLSGVVISFSGLLIAIMVVSGLANFPIYIPLVGIIISIPGIVLSSLIGIIIDLNFPKLNWDNEQKAVKQNMNVLFNMLINVLLAGGIAYLAIIFTPSIGVVLSGILIISIVFNTLLYKFLVTNGVRLFEKIEV